MNRTLIVASFGFVAAFVAERLFTVLSKDIERYDRMRAMSNQPPMMKEVLATLGGLLGGAFKQNGVSGLIAELTEDVVRYARMKGM